ncbi:hypothetical protein [Nocardia sp. CA-120079]|uniref:hypothetical protein n=1 Tax=Nocardia sp. CA-120079 TaxID=3239974 RepID=UPI003D9938C8
MLFSLPSLRLVLPADAYKDVPACWWGPERFVAHGMALYDMHYKLLYDNRMVDSVGRETFLKYLRAEAGVADFRTGRNARASIAHLMRATGMSESTIHRCRRLLYKFGCRTVVYRGRQHTKAEALQAWDRSLPKTRGWAAVAALHETTVFPVDNQLVKTLVDQGIGTPPERSEGSAFLSRIEIGSSTQNAMKGRASRGMDKKGRAKRSPAYDQRAVKRASEVRRDERFPLWVREIRPGRMAAVLTRKAVAGWDVDDIYGGLEEYRISGKTLLTAPRNPAGYLWSVLAEIPDDMPPARLDRARTVALEEADRLARQRQRDEDRAKAMLAADGMNAEARRLRDELEQGAANRAARRAREADEARRELAQRAREN